MSENEMEAAAAAAREDDEQTGEDADKFVWTRPGTEEIDPDTGETKPGTGETIKLSRPTPAQQMVLNGGQSGIASVNEQMAIFVNYFYALVSKNDKGKVQRWLLDPEDDFEMESLVDVLQEAAEHWSGRPTVRSSGSSGSRKSTGRKSTPGGRRSTRSTSASTDSST